MEEEAGSALDRAPLEGFKDFYQYASPTRVIAGRELLESTGFEFLKEGAHRVFLVTDQVIRHLVVRVDEEIRVADRTRDARKANQARRRVARGLPPEPAPGEKRGDQDMDDDRDGMEVQR